MEIRRKDKPVYAIKVSIRATEMRSTPGGLVPRGATTARDVTVWLEEASKGVTRVALLGRVGTDDSPKEPGTWQAEMKRDPSLEQDVQAEIEKTLGAGR